MSGARPSQTSASQRRRAAILDAARWLIADRGVDKLVIADIAARADVSVATIYNLVGTRDRLLIAVLDDAVEQVRQRLASGPTNEGVEGCLDVVRAACETVLADALTVRTVIASVGSAAPDVWLTEGLEGAIRERVDAAVAAGCLDQTIAAGSIAQSIHLGFRGALISWVFGLLADDELGPHAELMALHVLANAAHSDHREAVQRQLLDLASSTPANRKTR